MSTRRIDNGNHAANVGNGIEMGEWHSARIDVMHEHDKDRAEISVYARSDSAMFTRYQLLELADDLRTIACGMPHADGDPEPRRRLMVETEP